MGHIWMKFDKIKAMKTKNSSNLDQIRPKFNKMGHIWMKFNKIKALKTKPLRQRLPTRGRHLVRGEVI